MFDRRTFLKIGSTIAGQSLFIHRNLFAFNSSSTGYFKLNPFIEENDNRVFIYFTDVDHKYDYDKKKQTGLEFGRSVFVQTGNEPGAFSVNSAVAMKPNLTERGKWQSGYSFERTFGVVTDVDFMEGFIESVKELGVNSSNIHIREVNGADDLEESGYIDLADATGIDVQVVSTQANYLNSTQVIWKEVDNGLWFKRIPYLAPLNQEGAFHINISKMKAHAMGMTLCSKNLQGSIAANYQKHCTEYENNMAIRQSDVVDNAKNTIAENYLKHKAIIPRWDKPGTYGGIWQEIWASRCLDNNSAFRPQLHVIEGIIGRDGHFVMGPHDGYGQDFMLNVLIFGKNPFHVDLIGSYLAGHEPGNFGLFHMALERGLSKYLNPHEIPLFSWDMNSNAESVILSNLERTPLKTYYLQKNYNGQNEDYWHLCNEEFDYSPYSTDIQETKKQSNDFSLSIFPNPMKNKGFFSFYIPEQDFVQIDIFNPLGRQVSLVFQGVLRKGNHLLPWSCCSLPSGVYFYRVLSMGRKKSGVFTIIR